jgi:hypothetical protein
MKISAKKRRRNRNGGINGEWRRWPSSLASGRRNNQWRNLSAEKYMKRKPKIRRCLAVYSYQRKRNSAFVMKA